MKGYFHFHGSVCKRISETMISRRVDFSTIQELQGLSCILFWFPGRTPHFPSGISKDQSSYTVANSRTTGNLLYFLKRKTSLFLSRISGRDEFFIFGKEPDYCIQQPVQLPNEPQYESPASPCTTLQRVPVQLFDFPSHLWFCLSIIVIPQNLPVDYPGKLINPEVWNRFLLYVDGLFVNLNSIFSKLIN